MDACLTRQTGLRRGKVLRLLINSLGIGMPQGRDRFTSDACLSGVLAIVVPSIAQSVVWPWRFFRRNSPLFLRWMVGRKQILLTVVSLACTSSLMITRLNELIKGVGRFLAATASAVRYRTMCTPKPSIYTLNWNIWTPPSGLG